MPTWLGRLLPTGLRSLLRGAARTEIPSMRHLEPDLRLGNLARLGFAPAFILDVGAASGAWARMAAGVWPRSRIFGVEPNATNRLSLDATRADLPAFNYWIGLLGPGVREQVAFRAEDVGTSVLSDSTTAEIASADMLTVDELVLRHALASPDFLKLDVQGYELEVLRGAPKVLARCEGILIEVSFRRFWKGAPVAHEVIMYLLERGFVWYDVAGILRLEPDDELAQMDLLFVRAGNPVLHRSPWPWPEHGLEEPKG
ncbi:MAG: FkbM family methyltransferase [Polyangiaceae bacterium]|nr:FkbM family methyltransferase [Polyangiaceae bacterium]